MYKKFCFYSFHGLTERTIDFITNHTVSHWVFTTPKPVLNFVTWDSFGRLLLENYQKTDVLCLFIEDQDHGGYRPYFTREIMLDLSQFNGKFFMTLFRGRILSAFYGRNN